jgi:hypothetical protein
VAASARATIVAGLLALLALLAAGGLSGCVSTQDRNERAKLRATRLLASRELPHVTARNPDVEVVKVSLVRGRAHATAIVVDLRSSASKPLTDVPIVVGVRSPGGRRVAFNLRRRLEWFQTHVPAIPAGEQVTWVFEGRRRVEPGDRPFARVGIPAAPAISSASSLPKIAALPAAANDRRAVRVVVENTSDVPQFGLQVYALVRTGGRYVAAGTASIEHLGTGQRKAARVPLTGSARERQPAVHASPTIFR